MLVGGDAVFPYARLGDFTAIANESNYASTFGPNSDLFSSLRLGNFLSDDPYGDVNPVPYLNRQLYIPELAVGRLVETPAQMIGAIGRFVSFSGRLDPHDRADDGLRLPHRRSAAREGFARHAVSAPRARTS